MTNTAGLPTLRAKFLRAEVYGPDGWDPRPERTRRPSWVQIEQAIRRLDRFQHPWIWLFLTEEETEEEAEEPEECLTVMGGRGVYFLDLNAGEHEHLTLLYPDAPHEEVEVWESDQGLSVSLREVTSDIDLVLRVAKHFADTGEPLPGAPWAKPAVGSSVLPRGESTPVSQRSRPLGSSTEGRPRGRRLRSRLDRSILFVSAVSWAIGTCWMWFMIPGDWGAVAIAFVSPVLGAAVVGWMAGRPIGCAVAVLIVYVVLACLSASVFGAFLPPFWRNLWILKFL